MERDEVSTEGFRQTEAPEHLDLPTTSDISEAHTDALQTAAEKSTVESSGFGTTMKAEKVIQIIEQNQPSSDKKSSVSAPAPLAALGPPIPRSVASEISTDHAHTSITEHVHKLRALRKRQGLGVQVPTGCHLEAKPMEGLNNDTATTMRYSKVSTTPDCNCTHFLTQFESMACL